MTLDNLKHCEARFVAFMGTKHGMDFSSDDDTVALRQQLFGAMQAIRKAGLEGGLGGRPSDTLQDLNNAALNHVREALLRKTPIVPTLPPPKSRPHSMLQAQAQTQAQAQAQTQAQTQAQAQQPFLGMRDAVVTNMMPQQMSRDRDVYGQRDVQIMHTSLLAQPSSLSKARESPGVLMEYERASNERAPPSSPTTVLPPISESQATVSAMDTSEFENRLSEMNRAREDEAAAAAAALLQRQEGQDGGALAPAIVGGSSMAAVDPVAFARRAIQEADEFAAAAKTGGREQQQHFAQHDVLASPLGSASRTDALQAPPSHVRVVTKYLTLSGANRDLAGFPTRFRFAAKTGGRQTQSTLQGSYSNIAWIEATRLVIPMEAVNATGSVVTTKGFYNFEYSFAFPYLLLQIDEIEDLCDGTNEAIRQSFCTLLYDSEYKAPNGRGYVILKPAQDERKEYSTPMGSLPDLTMSIVKPNGTLFNSSRDAYTVSAVQYEAQNPTFLKVVVNQYFDRNEYWVGDYVNLSGMVLSGTPTSAANALVTYLTRPEGFEIVQLGASNAKGYFNSFYILGPGVLDPSSPGIIVIDSVITAAASTLQVATPARLLNASLQPVVTMRVGCLIGQTQTQTF